MNVFIKQPSEVLDYDVDLSAYLPTSDTIFSATPAVSPSGLTFGITSINGVTKVVKQWISSGTNGTTYTVTMTIVSTEGRTKEVEFRIKCKDIV